MDQEVAQTLPLIDAFTWINARHCEYGKYVGSQNDSCYTQPIVAIEVVTVRMLDIGAVLADPYWRITTAKHDYRVAKVTYSSTAVVLHHPDRIYLNNSRASSARGKCLSAIDVGLSSLS